MNKIHHHKSGHGNTSTREEMNLVQLLDIFHLLFMLNLGHLLAVIRYTHKTNM